MTITINFPVAINHVWMLVQEWPILTIYLVGYLIALVVMQFVKSEIPQPFLGRCVARIAIAIIWPFLTFVLICMSIEKFTGETP